MTRRRNKSGGGIDISTLLLLGVGGYLAYSWYAANYSTVVTTGTSTNPITVPGAPAASLVVTGPLQSTPVGPGVTSAAANINLPDDTVAMGVAGFFDSKGMW